MKINIDTTKRFSQKILLIDSVGDIVSNIEGDASILELLDRLLKGAGVKPSDLGEIKTEMKGESRVGILIGVSAANALSYALGLKSVNELTYPSDDSFNIPS